jgi:hypothetical protein
MVSVLTAKLIVNKWLINKIHKTFFNQKYFLHDTMSIINTNVA